MQTTNQVCCIRIVELQGWFSGGSGAVVNERVRIQTTNQACCIRIVELQGWFSGGAGTALNEKVRMQATNQACFIRTVKQKEQKRMKIQQVCKISGQVCKISRQALSIKTETGIPEGALHAGQRHHRLILRAK